MYFNLLILFPTIALPYVIWRKGGKSSNLFLGAALAWACYGAWICSFYGLSETFKTESTGEATLNYWFFPLRTFGSFFGAYIVLKTMHFLGVSPHRLTTNIAFWGFAVSIFVIAANAELFIGYQYPPIWFENANARQVGVSNLVGHVANLFVQVSKLLFFAAVIVSLVRGIPIAITYIRSL